MSSKTPNRRGFIKSAGAAAGALAVSSTVASASPVNELKDANSKFRIGFIGPGGRGFGAHVKTLTKLQLEGKPIELVSVCDVYNKYCDRAAKHIEKETGKAPTKYVDFLEMIEKEDLDAVCIGTPDHWHAVQAITSLEKGLHVYCEKPMTKTVEEAIDVRRLGKRAGK